MHQPCISFASTMYIVTTMAHCCELNVHRVQYITLQGW